MAIKKVKPAELKKGMVCCDTSDENQVMYTVLEDAVEDGEYYNVSVEYPDGGKGTRNFSKARDEASVPIQDKS